MINKHPMVITGFFCTSVVLAFWGLSAQANDASANNQQPLNTNSLQSLHDEFITRSVAYHQSCLVTGDCITEQSTATADNQAKELYATYCSGCHSSGVLGAPVKGNLQDWQPRLSQNRDSLYNNAINGVGAMPAKGGSDLTNEQVMQAVDYLISDLEQN